MHDHAFTLPQNVRFSTPQQYLGRRDGNAVTGWLATNCTSDTRRASRITGLTNNAALIPRGNATGCLKNLTSSGQN